MGGRGWSCGSRQEAAPDGPGGTSCLVNIVRIVLVALTHARSAASAVDLRALLLIASRVFKRRAALVREGNAHWQFSGSASSKLAVGCKQRAKYVFTDKSLGCLCI